MSIAHATLHTSDIIVANDPDADRLAAAERVVVKDTETGEDTVTYRVFNGNQLGVLLGYYMLRRWRRDKSAQMHNGVDNASDIFDFDNDDMSKPLEGQDKVAMLNSVVSSVMLGSICKREGVYHEPTLTGFKWLGNRSMELKQEDKGAYMPIFAYEEALGYAVLEIVPDKDGVSALALFVEMAAELKEKGMTVSDELQRLYDTYGEFVSVNSYLVCEDPVIMAGIFKRLREHGDAVVASSASSPSSSSSNIPAGYWKSCGGVSVVSLRDVTKGFDSATIDGSSSLPATPEADMLMFSFANGCTVSIRGSGTEPKLKYYVEMAGEQGRKRCEVEAAAKEFAERVVVEMLQPEENGLRRA